MSISTLPDGFRLRRPMLEDAQAVNELIVACDIADYGEADTDINDLLGDWAEIDLSQDAWVVEDEDGRLVGYTAVFSRNENRFQLDYYSDPTRQTAALTSFLIEVLEPRIVELAPDGKAVVNFFIGSVNEHEPPLLRAAGYQIAKYHFRMLIEMDEPPAAPVWPEGIVFRNTIPGVDDEAIYHFINTAFDWPDRGPEPTFEQWRNYMMRPDHFIPELWFLVYDEEELIGSSLGYSYEEFGWVRLFAVRKDWRGRGLGSALLQHMFGVFYERGHRQVALGVDGKNLNAQAFYKRLGMKVVRQFDEYRKTLN